MRNHHGVKTAALFGAVFVCCAQPSFAAPIAAKQFFLAKSSESVWPWMIVALAVGGILRVP